MSTGLVRTLDAEAPALVDQPAGALAPGGDDDGVGGRVAAVGRAARRWRAAAAVVAGAPLAAAVEDALDAGAGAHGDARFELVAHAREDVVRALGAHVAHRRGHERHAVEQRLAADLLGLLCRRRGPRRGRRTRARCRRRSRSARAAALWARTGRASRRPR